MMDYDFFVILQRDLAVLNWELECESPTVPQQ